MKFYLYSIATSRLPTESLRTKQWTQRIQLFGVTENGKSIIITVTDFEPWLLLEPADQTAMEYETDDSFDDIVEDLNEEIYRTKQGQDGPIRRMEIIENTKLVGPAFDKKDNLIRVFFDHSGSVYKFRER